VSGTPIYHVGIVVNDIDAAMAQFSVATGITWAPVQRDIPVHYGTPDGEVDWNSSFVYSKEMPHIELLQQIPGSIWDKTGFHHLGLWSPDVDADSRKIEQSGCAWEVAMVDDAGTRVGGCYHWLDDAFARIELCSIPLSRPRLERYLAGENYFKED
jgi:hypothetical protein